MEREGRCMDRQENESERESWRGEIFLAFFLLYLRGTQVSVRENETNMLCREFLLRRERIIFS